MDKEIWYNIINSLIAGGLVFFGSLTTILANKDLCWETFLIGIGLSVCTSAVVAIQKFKSYWESEEKEYKSNLLNFL